LPDSIACVLIEKYGAFIFTPKDFPMDLVPMILLGILIQPLNVGYYNLFGVYSTV
jgi:hypothetical protein